MSKFLVRNNLIGIGLTDLQKNGENQYSHPHTVRRPCLFTYMPSKYLKSENVFFADERAFVCQSAGKSVVKNSELLLLLIFYPTSAGCTILCDNIRKKYINNGTDA